MRTDEKEKWPNDLISIDGNKNTIYWPSRRNKNLISIGCRTHTISYWLKHYKEIGKKEGYSPLQIAEYGDYIRLFAKFSQRCKRQAGK